MVDVFFQLNNQKYIQEIYNQYADSNSNKISDTGFCLALKDLGISRSTEEENVLFKEADLDEDGLLDLQEFKGAISKPTKLEQWSDTLPFARLLACCLQSAEEGFAISRDPLRLVCKLDPPVLDSVALMFCEGVKRLLAGQMQELKICYEEMDRKALESADGSNSKFQAFTMSAGTVDDFYKGLTDRVGKQMFQRRVQVDREI